MAKSKKTRKARTARRRLKRLAAFLSELADASVAIEAAVIQLGVAFKRVQHEVAMAQDALARRARRK